MGSVPVLRVLAFGAALAALATISPALLPPLLSRAHAGEALQEIEREFKAGIEKVTAATVVCTAKASAGEQAGSSSGVIVSRRGLILSDGDVGLVAKKDGTRISQRLEDVVEIRVPNLKKGDFTPYTAKVVRRIREIDSTLLRIENVPSAGFPRALVPGTSDGLQVGDFTFAMGNSFGLATEAPPSLTAGIVASLVPLPPSTAAAESAGRFAWIYTSAAVNPGVNGGPLVDVEGRLVATISGAVMPSRDRPDDPYQFLGKCVPMDRIRAAYRDLPEAAELFAAGKPARERSKSAAALEATIHAAAMAASPWVVSLTVDREGGISTAGPQGGATPIRYTGPVSGILLSREGWIVTSLYNLTSLATLETPPAFWPSPPPDAEVGAGLKKVKSVTAHLPDGRDLAARIVSHDPRLGIVLLRAELPATVEGSEPVYVLPEAPPAPPESFREGRFAVAVGNPFGATRLPDPLITVGILSKRHDDDAAAAWRGQWQTDAGATDGNCGGAVVDLTGRALGMLTIWSPSRHGRNSGIGFVVPWDRVLAALPDLEARKPVRRGYLGIQWKGAGPIAEPRIDKVVPGSPADKGGLLPEDLIVRVGDMPVNAVLEAMQALAFGWEGDRVRLAVRRGEQVRDLEVTLGARPSPPAETKDPPPQTPPGESPAPPADPPPTESPQDPPAPPAPSPSAPEAPAPAPSAPEAPAPAPAEPAAPAR